MNTENISLLSGKDPEPCCRIFTFIVSLIFLGAVITGATLCTWAFFRRHNIDFDNLRHADLQVSQGIYADSVARQVKDILLTNQNAELASRLPPEAAIREANFWLLYWAILNETATRINEHMVLMQRLANETADRIAGDDALNAQLPPLDMMMTMAEQYNVVSMNKFMLIMAQIAQLDTDLLTEIQTRITLQNQKYAQAALADQTINYINVTLAKEAHDRAIKDTLLMDQLNAVLVLGTGLQFLNGVAPVGYNFTISSSNPITTIYEHPSQACQGKDGKCNAKTGRLVFENHGIATINGVARNDTTGCIEFLTGDGGHVPSPGPHSLLIGSPFNPTPPNRVYLKGNSSIAYSTADVTPLFGSCVTLQGNATSCGPHAKKIWLPVLPVDCALRNFPLYNGNTCGWTAPENGTYIVEIVATFSVTMNFPYGNWLSTFVLAIQDQTAPSDYQCEFVHPETGGCMTARDTVTVGGPRFLYTRPPSFAVNLVPSQFWPESNIDVVLKTTEIVNTPGGDTSGCFDGSTATCSYGLNPMFTVDIQGISIRATTLEYFITQIQMPQ